MANAIRVLAMDAVQQANSGHPGMPMGMAEIAVALWSQHYSHNPANPKWINRDRFVVSNGHGSMLHYALLPLMKAAFIETNPIPIKTAMKLAGLDTGEMRLPMCAMEEANRKKLEKAMKDYGIAVKG